MQYRWSMVLFLVLVSCSSPADIEHELLSDQEIQDLGEMRDWLRHANEHAREKLSPEDIEQLDHWSDEILDLAELGAKTLQREDMAEFKAWYEQVSVIAPIETDDFLDDPISAARSPKARQELEIYLLEKKSDAIKETIRTQEELYGDGYEQWYDWLQVELYTLYDEAAACFGGCPAVLDRCYEPNCFLECDAALKEDRSQLKVDALSYAQEDGLSVTDQHVKKVVDDMIEYDINSQPKIYTDCIIQCMAPNCFPVDCMTKCAEILER